MVSSATIIAVSISFGVSTILPILLWVLYGCKNKGKGVWTAWLLGAVASVLGIRKIKKEWCKNQEA